MKPSIIISLLTKADKLIKKQKYLSVYGLILVVFIQMIDYNIGPMIQFPILYLIPIGLASWYSGKWWGLLLAIVMPLVRFYFYVLWSDTLIHAAINASIRIFVFAGFAYLVDKIHSYKHQLEKEIHILEGILPICSYCKKIRNKNGQWEGLENYISGHSEAEFSHGLCPECAKINYPEFIKR